MENRRDFLLKLSVLTGGVLLPWNASSSEMDKLVSVLPLRKLGNTGEKITMLGLGGYHIGWPNERDAQETIETAIELGVRFFDTAYSYGKGESELRYGKYLTPKFKDQIFLMTKSGARDYSTAKAELEESLRRLNVDQIDLWQLHSLESAEDVDARIKNGVLDAFEEALKEKKIRYAGYTCHKDPGAILRMNEQTKDNGLFSTTQLPINIVDANSSNSFIEKVLPRLTEQGMGILAMKSLADGRFFSKKALNEEVIWENDNPVIPAFASIEEAMHFVWSLPVSVLITGAENATYLREKVEFAKTINEFSATKREELIKQIASYPMQTEVEYYKK